MIEASGYSMNVTCDGGDGTYDYNCEDQLDIGTYLGVNSDSAAIKYLRKIGWMIGKEKAYCPHCKEILKSKGMK